MPQTIAEWPRDDCGAANVGDAIDHHEPRPYTRVRATIVE